jgi:hypothetical protein
MQFRFSVFPYAFNNECCSTWTPASNFVPNKSCGNSLQLTASCRCMFRDSAKKQFKCVTQPRQTSSAAAAFSTKQYWLHLPFMSLTQIPPSLFSAFCFQLLSLFVMSLFSSWHGFAGLFLATLYGGALRYGMSHALTNIFSVQFSFICHVRQINYE